MLTPSEPQLKMQKTFHCYHWGMLKRFGSTVTYLNKSAIILKLSWTWNSNLLDVEYTLLFQRQYVITARKNAMGTKS